MTLIVEKLIGGIRRRLGPKAHVVAVGPRQLRDLPRPRRLIERRFLPMSCHGRRAEFHWIDDDGHEREQHWVNDDGSLMWSKWHRFEDAQGRLYAIRCPATLENDERLRIRVDLPEGSLSSILTEYGRERPAESGPRDTWER